MENFITILAWIFGVLSTLLTLFKIWAGATYSNRQKQLDSLRGVKTTYPIYISGSIMIVCWAWILKDYMN